MILLLDQNLVMRQSNSIAWFTSVLSQPINPDDEDCCFWVGEVELRKLEEGLGSQMLSELSYSFKNNNENLQAGSDSLIYFCLQGDIYIEVVCDSYKIFQEFIN